MNQEQHLSETLESLKNYSTPSVSARELSKILDESAVINEARIKSLIAEVAVGVLKEANKTDKSLEQSIATVEKVAKDLAGDSFLLKKELAELKDVLPTESYNKLAALVSKTEESTRERTRLSMEIIDSQLAQMLTGKSVVAVGVGGKSLLETVVNG